MTRTVIGYACTLNTFWRSLSKKKGAPYTVSKSSLISLHDFSRTQSAFTRGKKQNYGWSCDSGHLLECTTAYIKYFGFYRRDTPCHSNTSLNFIISIFHNLKTPPSQTSAHRKLHLWLYVHTYINIIWAGSGTESVVCTNWVPKVKNVQCKVFNKKKNFISIMFLQEIGNKWTVSMCTNVKCHYWISHTTDIYRRPSEAPAEVP